MRGCSVTVGKKEMIGSMFEERKLDVLALCETKMKGKGDCDFGRVSGRISGVVRGRAREGVAILVSQFIADKVVEWQEVSSRIMWVKVKFGRESWVFVSAYGPGREKSDGEREDFWSGLDECLQSFGGNVRVVVLGDLNARVGDECIDGVVGRFGVPGRNDSGESLITMCIERGLAIGNTWFKKKEIHKYTWVRQTDGRVVDRALMDYVLISRDRIGRLLDIVVRRGVGGGMSDHFLVEGSLKVKSHQGQRRETEIRRALKVSELDKENKVVECQEKVQREWVAVKEKESGSAEEEWRDFKSAVERCAVEVCGMRKVGGGLRKGSEWWCEEVKLAVAEKRQAFETWLQSRTVASYERYKETRRQAKRVVKEAQERADDRWGRKLTENFQVNKKMFWKEVMRTRRGTTKGESRVKTKDGVVLQEEGEVKQRWVEHFRELLNVETEGEVEIVAVGRERMCRVEGLDDEITVGEVQNALKGTKGGKAAGLDGCHPECLKKGGVSMVEWLVRLFNVCFVTSEVPVDWVSACIAPLFKGKGDKQECSNYRGISLLSVVGKVYGRVLINRIRRGTDKYICDEQGGFRQGRGCVDQIFAVRQVCEKFLEKGKEVYWAFMDLEKAYDRIDREGLWDVLRMYGVGGRLLRGVKSFYTDSRACVRVGQSESEWFPVKVGLRQGCVMSPWLFNIYMDGVVREVDARVLGRGVNLVDEEGGEWAINQVLFADDTALVADSEAGLGRLVEEFDRVCRRRKLKVNVGKSKVMRCSKEVGGRQLNIVLNGERLEEVDSFKYLGSVISACSDSVKEVKSRVNEVAKVQGGLKVMFNSKSLSMQVKRRLYEGIAIPTALYGAETWSMSVADKKRVNVAEMKCLRGMCGVTRMDRIRNEEVRRRTGVEKELAGRVGQYCLRWFGHVERMERGRIVKRLWRSEVRGERGRGRPSKRWLDGVKDALHERGMTVEQGRVLARDRKEWRRVVYA